MDTLDIAPAQATGSLTIATDDDMLTIAVGQDATLDLLIGESRTSLASASTSTVAIDSASPTTVEVTPPPTTTLVLSYADVGPPGPPGPPGSIEGFETDQYGRIVFDGGSPNLTNGA